MPNVLWEGATSLTGNDKFVPWILLCKGSWRSTLLVMILTLPTSMPSTSQNVPGALGDEFGVSRLQVTLQSVEDSSRLLEILSENPKDPDTVYGLHVSGVGSFSSLLTWPKLENLHHLEPRDTDFREARESSPPSSTLTVHLPTNLYWSYDSEEAHKHTMQPGDCCSIANAGLHPADDTYPR